MESDMACCVLWCPSCGDERVGAQSELTAELGFVKTLGPGKTPKILRATQKPKLSGVGSSCLGWVASRS